MLFISTTVVIYFIAVRLINPELLKSKIGIGGILLQANLIYAFFFLFRAQYKFVTIRKENANEFFISVFIGLSYIVSIAGLAATVASFFPVDITNEVGFEQLYGTGTGMLFSGIYQVRYFKEKKKAI